MARTSVASEADRLPWLTDEAPRRNGAPIWLRAMLGLIGLGLVAALFYWIGMNASLGERAEQLAEAPPRVSIPVPPPSSAEPPATEPQAMPEVAPAPVPPPVALPRQQDVQPDRSVAPPERSAVRRAAPARRLKPAPAEAAPSEEARAERSAFANPWESADASGRMVRIGTYASLPQGKRAWSKLVRVYPAMRRLPAVVTDIPSLRNGRTYYRLQIGTTSQAHSEVLCQRMRAIGQSCVVVDLAGARGKGSLDERQPVGL